MARTRNKGGIAKEYKAGNTTIVIHTDYCYNTTKTEIEKIRRGIAELALRDFAARNRSHSETV